MRPLMLNLLSCWRLRLRFLIRALQGGLLACLVLIAPLQAGEETPLPTLGHSGSYEVSVHQEHWLGQAWLRQFRAQARLKHDPVTQYYLEELLQRLSTYNPALEIQQLDVLLVDQPRLNAFAVPGGVVGVNTGLWVFAVNEDEFVSVLAHELAHISQRHFARRLEASRNLQWSTMAGLLAGILVASQGHADAGIATIATAQAANIQSQLAWSRSFEQEADRVGMETLTAAGYSPHAMPRMFEHMQRLAQLSGRAPEFLMTHPLTQSRIADAFSRADQSGEADRITHGLSYELLRIRQVFAQYPEPEEAWSFLRRQPLSDVGRGYAQLLNQRDVDAAEAVWQTLLVAEPEHLILQYLRIEWLMQQRRFESAASLLEDWLRVMPDSASFLWLQAELAQEQQDWQQARRTLQRLSQLRPRDPFIWFYLAEAAGMSDQRVLVHQARAEYFQLTGRLSQAANQMELAMTAAQAEQAPWARVAALRERQRELQTLRERLEQTGF